MGTDSMKETLITFTRENRDKSRDGTKTQTRRTVKTRAENNTRVGPVGRQAHIDSTEATMHCPYGKPGDVLLMAEPYRILACAGNPGWVFRVQFLDDDVVAYIDPTQKEYETWIKRKHPFAAITSRFMYKSLARTRFVVESVRVERVQDITDEDAIAEGIEWSESGPYHAHDTEHDGEIRVSHNYETARDAFRSLWDRINAKRGYGWDVNPWVWVVEYQKHLEATQ